MINVLMVCSAAAVVACGGEGEGAGESSPVKTTEAAYAKPQTPTIKPGSLRAFDVATSGEVAEVSLADAAPVAPANQASNWDWGDEGVHAPSNSGSAVEVEDLMSPGYVMMGIGARVGGHAVTRMRLRQIGIRNDWSWDPVGSVWRNWARHPEDDGANQAELELAIQKPYVAVGLGFGITDQNVKAIRIRKREYSPSQHKLIGQELEDAVGTGPGELYWDTSYITQPASQKEKMVIVGVGLRESGDDLTTLRVWAAYLD
jgi:hypothetical protein